MITPPLSISARPALTVKVPVSLTSSMVSRRWRVSMSYKPLGAPARYGPVQPAAWHGKAPHTSITRPSMRRNSAIWRRGQTVGLDHEVVRVHSYSRCRIVDRGAGVPRHSGAPGAPQPGGRSGPMSQTTRARVAPVREVADRAQPEVGVAVGVAARVHRWHADAASRSFRAWTSVATLATWWSPNESSWRPCDAACPAAGPRSCARRSHSAHPDPTGPGSATGSAAAPTGRDTRGIGALRMRRSPRCGYSRL